MEWYNLDMTTFEEFAKNAKNIEPALVDELPAEIKTAVLEDIEAGKISEELHKEYGIDIEPTKTEESKP